MRTLPSTYPVPAFEAVAPPDLIFAAQPTDDVRLLFSVRKPMQLLILVSALVSRLLPSRSFSGFVAFCVGDILHESRHSKRYHLH